MAESMGAAVEEALGAAGAKVVVQSLVDYDLGDDQDALMSETTVVRWCVVCVCLWEGGDGRCKQ
jgi:hypothetical protein